MSTHATYAAYPTRTIVPHESFLAYAPRGPGVMCALFYFAAERDIYGWWIGSAGGEFLPAYFLLKDFFSADDNHCYATRGGDLYGGWHYDYEREQPALAEPLAGDDAPRHLLQELQHEFCREWLYFADDPAAAAEVAESERYGFPVQPVNIQRRKLARFDTHDVVWTYASPKADSNVIDYLSQRWPLDYRLD